MLACSNPHFELPYEKEGQTAEGDGNSGGWGETERNDIDFGPNGSSMAVDTVTLDAFPQAGNNFGGHIFAAVSNKYALLISLKEWQNMPSAYHAKEGKKARDIANSYKEDEIEHWMIPTAEMADVLANNWAGDLSDINETLTEAGGDPISLTDSDGKNVRYLCDDGFKTFRWTASANILDAGKTVKTYRLRLVKLVAFKVIDKD